MQIGNWFRKSITTVRLSPAILGIFCICQAGFGQNLAIRNSIPVPNGYQRQAYDGGSFSDWIQNLNLKEQPVIRDYRGSAIDSRFYNVWGVVQMPLLFQSDLEQCADFAMRLWAEYHKATGKLDRLYLFDYSGNRKTFISSGKSFPQFLRLAFAGTNSHSLKQGCKGIASGEIVPGDMFVQNERGGIGHVSVVLDVSRSKEGKKLYLIGYSFMPAQEFHIEKAREQYGIEGWFTFEGYVRYLADFLNYGKPVLRRFEPL
jgi:Domain of unknown function (4846)